MSPHPHPVGPGSHRQLGEHTDAILTRLLVHKAALFTCLTRRWADLFDVTYDLLLYDLASTACESDPPGMDDDPRLTEILAELLRILGHDSVVATNGQEGPSLLAAERLNLVMTDIGMPEMDGLEATAAIREREQTMGRYIPIIALTAHTLKGAVSVFGAKRAVEAALQLEQRGRAGELVQAEDGFQALEQAMAELLPALERLMHEE